MYVYQVSEKDWRPNTKPHITIKFEAFCLEIKILSLFTLFRHQECKSSIKPISWRRAGSWAGYYLPNCLSSPQQHPKFKTPLVVWEDDARRGRSKSCHFGWHQLFVMVVWAGDNAESFRPHLAEMSEQTWRASLTSVWPRQYNHSPNVLR